MKLFAVVMTLAVLPVFAQEAQVTQPEKRTKEAWKWTLEERLADRLDPALMRERFARRPQPPVPMPPRAGSDKFRSIIVGADNPELFLPIELFGTLLGGLRPETDMREGSRNVWRTLIQDFGFDEHEFWNDLEGVTSEYLKLFPYWMALQERNKTWPPGNAEREMERVGYQLCAAKAAALRRAREHFGEETFDRFLYTVIAPATSSSSDPAEETHARLRFVERGCQ